MRFNDQNPELDNESEVKRRFTQSTHRGREGSMWTVGGRAKYRQYEWNQR